MTHVLFKALLLAVLIASVTVRPAFAYIDPNVGGQLFQILAAGFAFFSGIALLFSRQIRAGIAKARRYIREHVGGEDEDDNGAEGST